MSFWDHVDDLRRVILRSVGAIILLSVVFFTLMPRIFDSIILAPCHSDFILYRLLCDLSQHASILPDFCNDHFEVKLINIQLASQFFIHMSTSMWIALLFAFPYVIYQLWTFVSPGLYAGEKRNVNGNTRKYPTPIPIKNMIFPARNAPLACRFSPAYNPGLTKVHS